MKAFAWIVVLMALSLPAFANEGVYTIIVKKQEEKKQVRWTLAEWMETKNKMRLQDMWLALHSQHSPFEFFIGGDGATFERIDNLLGAEQMSSGQVTRVSLGAYASIFGLQGSYADLGKQDGYLADGSFRLRILGTSVQNSNITLFYGVKNHQHDLIGSGEVFNNNYYGGSLTLYLSKYFGLETGYYQLIEKESNQNHLHTGHGVEAAAFIDYGVVRVQATWFQDTTYTQVASQKKIQRSGLLGGLHLFF